MQGQARICQRCYDDHEGDDCVGYARNQGFVAGRKAAEKDISALLEAAHMDGVKKGRKTLETDFKVLLDLANGMRKRKSSIFSEEWWYGVKFDFWKLMRRPE